MAELLATGCERCSDEIAAALEAMPRAETFVHGGRHMQRGVARFLSGNRQTLIDGEHKSDPHFLVTGDAGLYLTKASVEGERCPCGGGEPAMALWRGKVALGVADDAVSTPVVPPTMAELNAREGIAAPLFREAHRPDHDPTTATPPPPHDPPALAPEPTPTKKSRPAA